MTRPRRLRWDLPEQPLPKHPYRDTAILYVVLVVILVLVAWLTGGSLKRAIILGALFFVVAYTWSWYRWRQQLARHRAQQDDEPL